MPPTNFQADAFGAALAATHAAGAPAFGSPLWQALLEQTRVHQVKWNWVRGHSGHVENERADALAVAARVVRRSRRLVLHLPEGWRWQAQWRRLFDHGHSPPVVVSS